MSKVSVTFQQDYIASRGQNIAGRKGDTKTYPMTPDLESCISEGILQLEKAPAAAKREKATSKPAE